jgi:anti-anti-sigma factor
MSATGELDLTTAPVLEERLLAELRAGHEVELDVSAVPFVDSSGLRALMQAARESAARQVAFRLLEPIPAQMRRVLEVTGLVDRLEIAPAPVVPEP